jgi:glucokinase
LISLKLMGESTRYSIGVDLGGTNLRAAAISIEGRELGKIKGFTNLKEGRDAVIEDIVGAIRSLRDQFGGRVLRGWGWRCRGLSTSRKG